MVRPLADGIIVSYFSRLTFQSRVVTCLKHAYLLGLGKSTEWAEVGGALGMSHGHEEQHMSHVTSNVPGQKSIGTKNPYDM